ncbi:MAG: hypothetical protein HKO65_04630 [Gemmatimonadetes bacterium]|nr:hypothetical protein [Gemmatimonadota bacterium]NNM04366.1 hypothetical protein [Gemmatimonadota bacterium]
MDDVLEAWRTNNRINLLLFDQISDEGMRTTLSKRGGRDVARQFAHIHDVRVYHLEKRAKDLAVGLPVFRSKDHPDRSRVREALVVSGEAIETFLDDLMQGREKRRGFKKGVATTLAYLVAHESHHRGSILLTLKTCGHAVDKNTAYGIWAWDQV